MDKIYRKFIGKKFQLIQQELNLTTSEFADSIGVSAEVITNIKSGRSVPTDEQICKLKTIYGFSEKLLLGMEENIL